MSTIPSLSVWSSIKIPSPRYGRNWNETSSNVSYMGSRRKITQKNNFETTQKVVYLRVPSPLNRRTENSFPDVTSYQIPHKKGEFLKRPQHISSLCVSMHASEDENHGKNSEDELCRCSESHENLKDVDDKMEFDSIPSVKSWTPEELLMLNEKYHLVEEKVKRGTEKKKKNKRRVKITRSEQTTPKTPNKCSCLDLYKSHKSLTQNFCRKDHDVKQHQEETLPPAKITGRNYYETKLAELYLIELGIKG